MITLDRSITDTVRPSPVDVPFCVEAIGGPLCIGTAHLGLCGISTIRFDLDRDERVFHDIAASPSVNHFRLTMASTPEPVVLLQAVAALAGFRGGNG